MTSTEERPHERVVVLAQVICSIELRRITIFQDLERLSDCRIRLATHLDCPQLALPFSLSTGVQDRDAKVLQHPLA